MKMPTIRRQYFVTFSKGAVLDDSVLFLS